MGQQKLLSGEIMSEGTEVDDLRAQIRRLEAEVRAAGLDTQKAQNDSETARNAIRALRDQLLPLFRALKLLFGEIDMVAMTEPADTSKPAADAVPDGSMSPQKRAVWDAWKSKLGKFAAMGIDALMVHGELDTSQLAIATGLDRRTITKTVVYKLNQAGLIKKIGDRFSLKAI